jgi:hypothetical protein
LPERPSRSSLRDVSSIRSSWLASVFTCTALYNPTRIICAIPRASLRSLLFTCWARGTAFMRVSLRIPPVAGDGEASAGERRPAIEPRCAGRPAGGRRCKSVTVKG